MEHVPSSFSMARDRTMMYTLPGGWHVCVGRTDADNDFLSFRVAKPADW